jgi:hypothetical protein
MILDKNEHTKQSIEREIKGIEYKISQIEHAICNAFKTRNTTPNEQPKIELLEGTYRAVEQAFYSKDYRKLKKECDQFKKLDRK